MNQTYKIWNSDIGIQR